MINVIELPLQDLTGLVRMISYLITTIMLRLKRVNDNNTYIFILEYAK